MPNRLPIAALLALLLTAPAAASGATHTGIIDHVADGDTVVLSSGETIRLVQIDTPEVYGDTECYGRQASALTESILPAGTRVRVATDPALDQQRSRRPHARVCLEGLVAGQSAPRARGRRGALFLLG